MFGRGCWRVVAILLLVLLSQLAPLGSGLPPGLPVSPAARAASQWYVDQNNPGASDSNSCASSSAPCKTIGGALGKAASGDTITVNPGTYNECLTLSINVTLSGAGASSTAIDGTGCGGTGTVVTVNGGASVSLSGVTIQHGTSTNGGGINNSAGTLTLNNVVVTSNTATATGAGLATGAGTVTTISNSSITGDTIDSSTARTVNGGGIYNQGTLTLDRSTVANNLVKTELSAHNVASLGASATGGGIDNTGTLNVTSSSIINNSAAYPDAAAPGACPGGGGSLPAGDCFGAAAGGGIANEVAGTAALTNSTVSGNGVTTSDGNGLGGGIWNAGGTLGLTNTTISANNVSVFVGPAGAASFAYGGGLAVGNPATPVSLQGTILANNSFGGGGSFNGPDCSTNFSGGTSLTSQGYNLIRDTSSCSIGGNTAGNITGQDPLLGPLQNNGGPTLTQLPAVTSPAIGSVASGCPLTDQRGISRPVFACTIGAVETDQANDTWAGALTLNQTSGSYQVNQTVSQHIYAPTQERWYKFLVTPGSNVHIQYSGLAGAVLSLHSDVQAEYNALTNPTSAALESAKDAAFNFLPQQYLPQQYLPQQYLPQQYLPQQYLPQQYLPQQYLPQQYLPQQYLPQQYLPQQYLPQQYLPGPYSGAADASLLALSATPNSSVQTIDHNTWNTFGYMYVRVAGPANPSTPFNLTVTESGGICAGVTATPFTPPAASSIPTGLKTLILWDPTRIAGSANDISTLSAKLGQFASRPEVQGAVIDLSQVSGIDTPAGGASQSANGQADSKPACPAAKNIVANDIKSVIQAYRAQNPGLQYIVLVGDDHSIPFFRYPDESGLAPENQFYPPVADSSASNASLRDNFVLGQDEYGASLDLPLSDVSLPIPDLAVGRLVKTAAEVSHLLDLYTAPNTNGRITPTSSLVTGYDFVADAATNAQVELQAGTNTAPDTLMSPQGQPPSASWTANDLRQKLFGSRHDVVFLAGHFSAGGLEAADYATTLSAAEVASSTVDMSNTLVLALGCHGGYNIPGGDAVPGISPAPDWPEALAEKGATLLSATGYAYGDTVLTEYGEHLFDNYLRQLRSYSGASYVPVTVGQANVAAKKEYLTTHTNLTGVDEKTLLETTLYGLPMLQVNMTGQHVGLQPDTSIVSSAPTVPSGPGQQFGLAIGQTGSGSSDIDVQPTLTSHTVPLTNSVTNAQVTATYLTGPNNGEVARPGEPIFPSQLFNVHVPNQILRGVGFRGGSYSDTSHVIPLTSAAGTETSVGHPAFYTNVLYPVQVWTANYFDAINGGPEHLVTTPAQYISASPGSTDGTLRQFGDLTFRLFYLPNNWTTNPTTSAAAVAAAPKITGVAATTNSSGQITFNVHVLSDQSAGTQGVWITYTDPSLPGTWTSVDLTQSTSDSTLWQYTDTTNSLPADMEFMVQAVNGTGLVSLSTNSGAFYTIGAPPTVSTPTTITVQSAPSSGIYQATSGTFQVTLQYAGSGGPTALSGQMVTLQLGSQQASGTTDANGTASIALPLSQPPGSYTVVATFAGATVQGTNYQASSSAPGAFAITPAPTMLSLAPAPAVATFGAAAAVTATLADNTGSGLVQRTVLFTVTGNGLTYNKTAITDYLGRAALGTVPLPAGTYSVAAAFGGADRPVQIAAGGTTVTESDPNFLASAAAPTSLTITPAPQTIGFGLLPNHLLGDAPFTVTATGGASGNPVTFSAAPGSVCTASGANGATITLVGVGTCTVTANQAGNQNYQAAAPVAQRFTVTYPPLYLALALTSSPPGRVTTGSVVTVGLTLGNHTPIAQTINLTVTLTFMGNPGSLKITVPLQLRLNAGQTLSQSVKFSVTNLFPRGTYMVSVMAKDGSGDTASGTATLTVS